MRKSGRLAFKDCTSGVGVYRGEVNPALALQNPAGVVASPQARRINRRAIEPLASEAHRKELGQFLTPSPIADFMASLFSSGQDMMNLLDAGAGAGALSGALIRRLCSERKQHPRKIVVTAYELDSAMIPRLRREYDDCAQLCGTAGIELEVKILNEDFIAAAVAMTRDELFTASQRPFNAAIVNPPYRKIQSNSETRLLLRSVGIETTNLYSGFMALVAKLLADEGELVAITPRSFCNGTYFKPFRRIFLDSMSLRRLHVFESRSAAFHEDEVLQENVIIHAVKSRAKPQTVTVSMSSGEPNDAILKRECVYRELVSPDDPEQFIHLVFDDSQAVARRLMGTMRMKLEQLGIEVSTGRVVDFRARDLLVANPAEGTYPIVYPCHFNSGFVHWPKLHGKKPNAIRCDALQRDLLVPAGVYVLVKRFSAKEEKRRVTACVYDPRRVPTPWVGFENHLNYFHERGNGLPFELAKGLTAFLNSTMMDVYFRQFNGHTQVNATDLRNIKYPSRAQLEALGKKIGAEFPTQPALDFLVEAELF